LKNCRWVLQHGKNGEAVFFITDHDQRTKSRDQLTEDYVAWAMTVHEYQAITARPDPPPERKPQPFKSDKQRRFVMAALSRGEIPYKRTGNLGRKWTSHISTSTNGLEGTVGNNVPYAPFVQSASGQSAYHQGVWSTDLQVFDRHHAAIERDFLTAIERALAGR
jgi:hypothetical protein